MVLYYFIKSFRRTTVYPYHLTSIKSILLTKDFITYFSCIIDLIIINRNKYNTIITQQVLSHLQSRINHVKPIGMKATIALCILHKLIAFFIILTTIMDILLLIFVKIVIIYKIVTCIVRWINIYHFHLTKIIFPQQF